MNKRKYLCELVEFVKVNHDVGGFIGKHGMVAAVIRLEHHDKLGPAGTGITHTSLVIRIDFARREFETLNSVYMWR